MKIKKQTLVAQTIYIYIENNEHTDSPFSKERYAREFFEALEKRV
jgi:hypothetical protein